MRRIAPTSLCTVLAVAGITFTDYAGAQTTGAAAGARSESAALEEITVTATRREERLKDVAVSVTAFSQEKLDSQGLRNMDDLSRLSPGVNFTRNGNGGNYNDEGSDISIRGIDSGAGASTTGVYIDDTPIQGRHLNFGSVNAFPVLFDIDRVEVLRGPQGTLFGAGSEGGTVRFLTPQPSLNKTTAYVRSEFASTRHGDPSYEASGAIGGPLIDGVLGYRLSVSYRRDGGYVDRVTYTTPSNNLPNAPGEPTYTGVAESDSNWQRTVSVRAALKWAINDQVSVTPSFYYQELYLNDTSSFWGNLSDPRSGILRNGNALPNQSTDPFWLASVKLDWDLGFGQLTSNTAYFSRNQHSVSDYTQYLRASYLAFPYPAQGDAARAYFSDQQDNFYQEVRLASSDAQARLTWNTGIFYSHLNENVPARVFDPTLDAETLAAWGGQVSACSAIPCPGGEILNVPVGRVIDQQIAAFGEASYKLTDTLKATVGLRVSRVEYTGTAQDGGAFFGAASISSNQSASEKPVTPKFVLSWQPDSDDLYYASASKGYRVGGINTDVGALCDSDLGSIGVPASADGIRHVPGSYSSDHLWSYELGAKNTMLDRRLQINSSVFVIDWKNIQQNVYLPTCGNQFTANLGQVRSQGGEIQVQARPVDSLLIDFTAAYADAKYTRTSCAGALTFDGTDCVGGANLARPIVSEGDHLSGAPWTFLAGAEYKFAPIGNRTPYLRVDYQYLTAQTSLLPGLDTRNGLNDVTIPNLPLNRNLSLRAGVRWAGIDVSVFAQNLTDAQPILVTTRDIPNLTDNLYFQRSVRPRTFGITGTYRFD